MPRKSRLKCPSCRSSKVEVIRSWTFTFPLPDAHGRITVAIMGAMKCRNCGYRWRGVVSKMKVGGEGEGEEEGEERRGKEIVLDLDEIMKEE